MEYSGDGGTITAIQENHIFHTYDGQDYEKLCSGTLLPSKHSPCALWAEGESTRFSTSFKTGQQLVIDIREIQPTSDPPLTKLESLPVQFRQGKLFFSPASFHASFITETEVVIIDVRSSEVLSQVKTPQPSYKPQGRFSPDGRFFVCETLTQEIRVWENTPTGYVSRDPLIPRSMFRNFKFSPNAASVLCWNQETIQLLDPDIRVTPPAPHESTPHRQHGDHIVAHSTSGIHTAITRRGQSIVKLFDSHLPDAPRQSIDTGMEIQDIKFLGEIVFVADTCRLKNWRLEAGVATIGETTVFGTDEDDVHHLALSKDCSRVLLVTSGPETQDPFYHLSVRSTRTGSILAESKIEFYVDGIGFFPDGHRVWLIEEHQDVVQDAESYSYSNWMLEIPKGEGSSKTEPRKVEEWPEGCPWISPSGYCIGGGGRWVMDSGSKLRLLWLPPAWRAGQESDIVLDGKFLTLLGNRPEPVVIEVSSQSLPLYSSVRLSDTQDPHSLPSHTIAFG